MQTGTYISGVGHVFLLGWAALGAVGFDDVAPPEVKVADVSLISPAEFAALLSEAPAPTTDVTAPMVPALNIETPQPPLPDTTPAQAVVTEPDDPQSAGEAPDVSEIAELPRTVVLSEAPDQIEQPTTETQGATLIVPTAPLADQDRAGQRQPDRLALLDAAEAPAPKVDTEAAPKPPTDAEQAAEVENTTTPDSSAIVPAEETVEKAPDQAATEIITEAKERPTQAAPVSSSRPKGRPVRLADRANTPSEIELALAAAQAEQAATNATRSSRETPSGPPLSGQEQDSLRRKIGKTWNVGALSTEALYVTVTVSFSLSVDGKITRAPELVSSVNGSSDAADQAFETARRAILRAVNAGLNLPKEKYDHWRDVEMTFNPEKMRIK